MKKQINAALVLAGFGFAAASGANAGYETNPIYFGMSAFPSWGQYSLTLESGTSVWFDKTDYCHYGLEVCGLYPILGDYSTLTPTAWTVDTEMDIYLVPYGAEFTMPTIASGQFSPLFTIDQPSTLTIPFGTFYLGIAAGGTFDGYGGIVGRSVYGWVELNNRVSGLEMVSYGNSTYVGVPVPEPAAYALMLSGLGLVGWASRGRRKQTEV